MNFKISKRKLLWTLSSAVDLVGITEISHGKRVAYIADALLKELKNFPFSQNDVISASLLHDCGVSSTDVHERLAMEMEWEGADTHCVRGEELLLKQPYFKHLASAVRYHHTRWSCLGRSPSDLLGNLIFLADRIDVLAVTAQEDILIEKERIISLINSYRGSMFNPEFIDAFNRLATNDIFWLHWSESNFIPEIKPWLDSEEDCELGFEELKTLFKLFSACVDGKSRFTSSHSIGVASLSVFIGSLIGLSMESLYKLELAALLHDLGKLRVPDYILDKKGSLDSSEFLIMKHHSYDTYRILSSIGGMEDIAKWASQHHEKLNGNGYPSGLTEDEIDLESKIIMIADIFQALAQDRPYRDGLDFDTIISILEGMVDKREIDRNIVSMIKDYPNETMASALV